MLIKIVGLLIAFAFSAVGQTQVQVSSVKCPGNAATVVAIGTPVVVGGVPFITFVCANLDPASLVLDKTTTPWTLKATSSPTVAPKMMREVPAGLVNGTNQNFTLSTAPASTVSGGVETNPTMVFRNGLLLTACPLGTPGNCDYQISGTSILFMNGQTPQTGDLIWAVYWR